jgi:hypothetical protein
VPTHAELFWRQSAELFERWDTLLEHDPARVSRECALYRRWIVALQRLDPESSLVCEVLLEMLADLMVDASLRS